MPPIAAVHAYRGEADLAFAWLDKPVDYHQSGVYDIGPEPYFAKIKSDARWLPLLCKIGVAPEQLARIEYKAALPADWRESANGADIGRRIACCDPAAP
jgi:hypothetical protein